MLTAGAKGKRSALPHARIMIHQPWGGVQGQATDIEIQTKEILNHRKRINEILEKHTGQTLKKIEKDTDRNYFMSAEECKKDGLINQVITKKKQNGKRKKKTKR